mmetsp:Transcript_13324/g.26791  ORF Transcript_13324/g.26791 Transcript_13324/m.26791 type:complete len:93 (-) Transcript_13324:801-1079(-)
MLNADFWKALCITVWCSNLVDAVAHNDCLSNSSSRLLLVDLALRIDCVEALFIGRPGRMLSSFDGSANGALATYGLMRALAVCLERVRHSTQ